MNILGEGEHTFILEATKDEVARLCGYYNQHNCSLKVGQEITVHRMYNQLYELSHYTTRMKDTQDKLRSMADSLELPIPFDIEA